MAAQESNCRFLCWSIFGAIVVLGLWAGSGWLIHRIYPAPNDHGTFGDMFGAINALFSGWAFLGVIIAIFLQKQELEEQRREIRESRMAQQESAEALGKQFEVAEFTARIDALNHIIIGYDRRIARVKEYETLDDKTTHERLIGEREKYEQQLQQAIHNYFETIGE